MKQRIYLDHNATTPVHPEALEAMLPYLRDRFGNPSSIHAFGQEARRAVGEARESVAELIGARPDEIIFTSGGTESDNLALQGAALAAPRNRRHIVTSAIEHSAVLNVCRYLESRGWQVTYLPVDSLGLVSPRDLAAALSDGTAIVSVMAANNEVGTVQPVAEISKAAHGSGALFHTDAVQALGKMPFTVEEWGVDLLSISAHKVNGPKGVGALYVRRGTRLSPILHGGHHEHDRRAGTENVAGIVGFGAACRVLLRDAEAERMRLIRLRERLEAAIVRRVPDAVVHGATAARLPNTSNISFPGVNGEALTLSLDLQGVAVSTGSACASGSAEPSHVLLAMGVPKELIRASMRLSLGRGNTAEDVDRAAEIISNTVLKMRQEIPHPGMRR